MPELKMPKLLLALLLCASVGLTVVFAQAKKPSGTKNQPAQPAQSTDAQTLAQAGLLLEAAGMSLELGDSAGAKAGALEALKLAQTDGLADATKVKIREEVKKLLDKIGKAAEDKTKADKTKSDEKLRQKHLAQIEQAEYLLSDNKPKEAADVIKEVLENTDDADVRSQANALLAKVNSVGFKNLDTFGDHVSTIVWWIVDIILVGLILLVFYYLLKRLRNRDAKRYKGKWSVRPIDDTTGLGVAGAIVESLNRWKESRAPIVTGLLRVDRVYIPTTPRMVNLETELDLAAALDKLELKVGTISVGGLAKAAGSIRNWFTAPRPSISGTAALSGDQVVVRLTRQTTDGKKNSVTASADKAKSVDAAEAASFKMYYLIATDTNVSQAESANKLREGMGLLREYFLFGRSPEKLTAAHETFRDVHIENPAFNEVYLYEGITLDLQERHDEAIKMFQYLADPRNTSSETLRKKARFNEAVSLFRKYRPTDLTKAIDIFDELIGQNPTVADLAASPIKALAYAAKANAIAHKPIFWQTYFYDKSERDDQQLILQRKREKGAAVKEWVTRVEEIAKTLEDVNTKVANDNKVWDEMTRRQLRWATENALGNTYLNYAKSFLQQPHLVGANEEEQRREYLNKAYKAFQTSEMILSPGVETLANLGTVLTELSRDAEARRYLERITTELNPQYEYAYYRIAQSWEKEHKTDKVIETLRSFAKVKAPSIDGFKELYQKYATALAQS